MSPSAVGSGQLVARASAGYSMDRPAAVTTKNGTTIVAWTETGQLPNRLRVRLQRGTGRWQGRTLPVGGLDHLGPVSLLEDRAHGRVFLTSVADDSVDTGATIGTWLWVSTDSGRSWSPPARIWDSVGTSSIATDGTGGFWLVTENTGLWLAHVPAALTPQHWPGDETSLTDRIASRSIVGVATVGRARTPVTYFSAAGGAWVHLGLRGSQADDRQLAAHQPLDAAVSGGSRIARVVVASDTGRCRVCLWDIGPSPGGTLQVVRQRRVGGRNEVPHEVALATLVDRQGRETTRTGIAWLTDSGQVRMADASGTRIGRARTLLQFPSEGRSFPEALTVAARWVVVLSHAGGDHHGVLTAARH